MKRNKRVKKTKPVEQSSDGSDTEDMPPPKSMKKVTRKTRNTISEVSSDSEDKSKPKLPMKNAKKKPVESSYCTKVAGSSYNSDTTVKSLLPDNVSHIVKEREKRISKRASSTTEPADNSDSEDVPQKSKKKGKKVNKREKPTSNDADTTVKSLVPENVSQIVKKRITKRASSTTEPADNSDSGDVPQKSKKKGKKVHKTVEPTSNDSDSEDVPQKSKKKGKKVTKTEEPSTSHDADTTVKSLVPENLAQIIRKRITKRASSTTEPADNSDSGDVPSKSKKKGKKDNKTEELTSDDPDSENVPQKLKKKGKKVHKTEEPTSNEADELEDVGGDEDSEAMRHERDMRLLDTLVFSDDSDEEDEDEETIAHKEYLDHLSRVDPQFYKFLEEHDVKLIEFTDHDNVLDESEDDDDEVNTPDDLHGGSDESDFDIEGALSKGNLIDTLNMVTELQIELQKSTIKLGTIRKTMKIFIAAMEMAIRPGRDGVFIAKFPEMPIFGVVLDVCEEFFSKAIGKYLGFETSGKDPQNCKNFVKIKSTLIEYLSSLVDYLLAFIPEVTLSPMLKHLHQLSAYLACFPSISKKAIKKLLPLWCSRIKQIRILAFRNIVRITRNLEESLLEPVIRAMFKDYVMNSLDVSPTTWPSIHFTRRALVTMYKLDLDRSYPHVFLYVRQLGIHLRNAIVVPKPEHEVEILNWQCMNVLYLCADVVSETLHAHSGMKSLYSSLGMIISYSIKLGSTPQYYPLRFFLIEMLMSMQEKSEQFITIKPFFMDVITEFDINKKHTTESTEPLDFSCIIRLSESQMNESGFKDAVVDRLYALLLEYLASLSYKIFFQEICMVLIIYFEDLVKKCNNPNHKKKLKELYDKIVENNDFIREKTYAFRGSFANIAHVTSYQNKIKEEGTPLLTYYENWKKIK